MARSATKPVGEEAVPPRSRRVRSRNGARSEDVRGAILVATERLLKERRLEEITVSDVIEAAGVSRASFYIYFESKYGPVGALAETITAEIYDTLWKPFFEGEERITKPLIRDHWLQTLDIWREHQAVLVAAAAAWRADPGAIDQWRAVWSRYVTDTRAFIERAREAGKAPTDLDADMVAALLTWSNEALLYLAFTGSVPELADSQRLVDTQTEVWIRAIFGTTPELPC
jgi:TetR/AcrR family transcriptional regulator, ethionamide resistance regulator